MARMVMKSISNYPIFSIYFLKIFLHKRKRKILSSDVVLASFDVETLFTNIPLSEICDTIENNLHQGNYNLPIKIE